VKRRGQEGSNKEANQEGSEQTKGGTKSEKSRKM